MIHKTGNGKMIPICSLQNTHLINIIKKDVKVFLNVGEFDEETRRLLAYMQSVEVSSMNMSVSNFNEWYTKNSLYIIEGLRRDSTRKEVLEILGTLNPIFKYPERITLDVGLLKSKNPMFNAKTVDLIDEGDPDLYEEEDGFYGLDLDD